MSYIYSRALVEAFSGANCSDTEPSAPSSGSPTPKPCLWHDRTMEVSRHSRYGMTCAPFPDYRGAELLTWWLAGFHAKTSALPERVQASPESVRGSGPTWRASLAKFDPDTSSWKTVQLSLLGDSELSSVTWPRSGMTADGQCWELPMLGRRTSETGSGFWQTPVADDAANRAKGKWNSRGEPKLSAQVLQWPTPVANDTTMRGKPCAQGGTPLSLAVTKWPTPNSRDYKGAPGRGCMERGGRQSSLPAAVKLWPTPTSTLGTNGGLVTPSKAREGGTLIEALSARTMWPTPTAHNAKEGAFPSEHQRNTPTLAAQAGGALNPNWVEWLMGWPIGWTALKPSETAKYHSAPQPHGESLEGLEA